MPEQWAADRPVYRLGTSKLYTGFALDANHVWIGGDHGVLLTNH